MSDSKHSSSTSPPQQTSQRKRILKLPGKRTCPYPHSSQHVVRAHLQRHVQRTALRRDLRETSNVSKTSENKGMADFLRNGPNRVQDIMNIARRTKRPDEIARCLAALSASKFPTGVILNRGGLIYALTLRERR